MDVNYFFDRLWQQYIEVTPQAEVIHQFFFQRDGTVVNDHVAFRTFDRSPIALEQLHPILCQLGYKPFDSYDFPSKHLQACAYLHADPLQPKVFLSELITASMSSEVQAVISQLVEQVDPDLVQSPELFFSGRLWAMPSYSEYQTLRDESEYAAWLAVMGFRANHFTVSVNHLKQRASLTEVLNDVEQCGFAINDSGGAIKGSPQQWLEQGSTLADQIALTFADGGTHKIPTCFYEFAKRYPDQSGELYQGFVASSADRIFESTHSPQSK